MVQYRFVVRSGPIVGKVYPLEAQEISIGRENTNTMAINDGEVSRRHARMELRGTVYVIQDLGSTNGTFVNGKRLTGLQELNPGDLVSLGEGIVLVYESVVDMSATLLSSSAPRTAIQRHPPAVEPAAPAVPAGAPKPAPIPMPSPVPAPASKPAPAPVPAPSRVAQVPDGPVLPSTPPGKKKFPLWLLILAIPLAFIFACIGIFVLIDQLRLWCQLVPFLVPLLGGAC